MSNEIENIKNTGAYAKPVMSVGEEFVDWADTYWKLGEKYEGLPYPQDHSESVTGEQVKKYFADQINEIIAQRFKHYM